MTARWRRGLDSIHLRVGAMIALVLVACAAMLFYALYQPVDAERQTYIVIAPADLRATVIAIERTDAGGLPPLQRALQASGTSVDILDRFPAGIAPPVGAMADRVAEYQAAMPGRRLMVQWDGGLILSSSYDERAVSTRPLSFLVGLKDGRVAQVTRASAPIISRIISSLSILFVAVAVLALAVTFIIARQMSLPVRRMSRALVSRDGAFEGRDLPVSGARELKELAIAFNAMRRRLKEAVDDRTRVLAAVAHDMRTYLTRLELRLDHIADPRQRALAEADLGEMTAMLNGTLIFASAVTQSAENETAAVDIAPIIRSIVEGRVALGEAVSLRIGSHRPISVPVGVVSIHRIAANLLDNAVRYGGSARVTLDAVDGDVFLIIEDDGPGVPDELLPELIKPFFRTDGSLALTTGGHGLGLAIVDTLVRRQGGSLQLSNRSGGGFRATVRFKFCRSA